MYDGMRATGWSETKSRAEQRAEKKRAEKRKEKERKEKKEREKRGEGKTKRRGDKQRERGALASEDGALVLPLGRGPKAKGTAHDFAWHLLIHSY